MNGFALWVGIGAALGLWQVARSVNQQQAGVWLNIGLIFLLLTFIGARLFYVAVHWAYFSIHLTEILQIRLGGLAWPGAVAGGWLALLILAGSYRSPRGARISIGLLSDRLYPLVPSLAITAWLGSWQIGALYGVPLPADTWWAIPSLDDTGMINLHWPLQPLAALSLLVFFAGLQWAVKPDRTPGLLSVIATTGLLLHLLAASLLRADPVTRFNHIPLDAWVCILYLPFFLTFVLLHNLASRIWSKHSYTH